MITAALVAMVLAQDFGHAFINSRTGWNRLNEADKNAYVMGLMDGTTQFVNDIRVSTFNNARMQCLADRQINSADLVLLVDEGYAADAANWNRSPLGILLQQTTAICRDQINEALQAEGYDPIP